jgi:hypothetical protein
MTRFRPACHRADAPAPRAPARHRRPGAGTNGTGTNGTGACPAGRNGVSA